MQTFLTCFFWITASFISTLMLYVLGWVWKMAFPVQCVFPNLILTFSVQVYSGADTNSIFILSFQLCYRVDSFLYVNFGPYRFKELEATRLLTRFSLIIRGLIDNSPKSISRKRLIATSCMTPQNFCKTQVNGGVSRNKSL